MLTKLVLRTLKMSANSRVYPRRSMAMMQNAEPQIIYGRRRPKRDLELSARMPAWSRRQDRTVFEVRARTDERLNYESGKRPGEKDERHVRLGQPQG
jgi:hypothetical protein